MPLENITTEEIEQEDGDEPSSRRFAMVVWSLILGVPVTLPVADHDSARLLCS